MGDCLNTVISEIKREENLTSAAKQILRALDSKKKFTDEEKKVLAELGVRLYTTTLICEEQVNEEKEIEEQLYDIQEKIMNWEIDQSMIWDAGLEEATEYLKAADEVRKITVKLKTNAGAEEKELLRRAHDVMQIAMARLEEEFKHLLVQSKHPFEPENMSFRSTEEDPVDVGSVISTGDDSFEGSLCRDSGSRNCEELIVDLIHPDVVSDLRRISNLMFLSGYSHECSQAYISVRRDALSECLFNLEIEKLSIEDVLKLDWGHLNSKIKRWVRAIKVFVHVYLASEKWLTEQIFGEIGMPNLVCFVEASKASMMQLLNFAEAVSIGPHRPEKLFPILDMYEVLGDLLPDIDSLFSDDAGSRVRTNCREVQRRLGEAVRAAFLEFENAIATNASATPFAGGGVHHLTRYVMNYIKNLTDYWETLNFLLEDQDRKDHVSSSPDMSPSNEEEGANIDTCVTSPVSIHFQSIASILECNLEDKGRLYKDTALQHIFLMNNLQYMAHKIKNSELRLIFGDKWIRKCNWKFQQHEMNYERATWSPILSLLRDEGTPYSNSTSRTNMMKEIFRSFYAAFEDVYRTQTAWVIQDEQLREDLRISISLKVIQAYRSFMGRHNHHVSDKHIKYSADDLQNLLLDLFGGSPKSLHNMHRR